MALATAFAAALVMQSAPVVVVAEPDDFDVGYQELVAGQDRLELERIDANTTLPADDPALLINKGIALAREGRFDAARAAFKTVLVSDTRYQLETAGGEWVDSRWLARRGLTLLNKGEFARYYVLSMR